MSLAAEERFSPSPASGEGEINGTNVSRAQVQAKRRERPCRKRAGAERLRARNAGGAHPFQASDAEYDLFTSYFVPLRLDEGFNVVVHSA